MASKFVCTFPTVTAFEPKRPLPMVLCFLPCSIHMAPRNCEAFLRQVCRIRHVMYPNRSNKDHSDIQRKKKQGKKSATMMHTINGAKISDQPHVLKSFITLDKFKGNTARKAINCIFCLLLPPPS